MATIYDIARATNVSHTTVSRVINGSDCVSPATREKVLKAIEELGYYPNDLARGLISKKTETIAIIIPDITNPFFTTVARGVEDAARTNQFSVLLCNTDDDVDCEKRYIDLVLRKQLDGVVLASAAKDGSHLNVLSTSHVPIVLLDRRVKGFQADIVRADSYGGARSAMQLLLHQGHQRIALVTGPLFIDSMVERHRGYCDALEDARLPIDKQLVLEGHTDLDSGVLLCDQLLSLKHPPTACLCTNNFLGLGVYTRLRERQLRVPEDFSVVVFDDIEEYSRAFPYLTTVTQPAYAFGQRAMELLLARMQHNSGELQEVVLPTELVARCTTTNMARENEGRI